MVVDRGHRLLGGGSAVDRMAGGFQQRRGITQDGGIACNEDVNIIVHQFTETAGGPGALANA